MFPTITMDERTTQFVIQSNYQPLDVIGEGAYGVVWCVDLVSRSPPHTHD